ncbi:MAG: flavin reductase family protein [Gemmataceae bacterium]
MTIENAESQQEMAKILGRIPSGLAIMTARLDQRETGLLVSWMQQCSFEPPQITVALRQGREVLGWLEPGSPFVVNLIAEGQNHFLSHFGKGFTLDQPAFEGLEVEREGEFPPILSSALGYLQCRVASRIPTGDHELVVGTIIAGRMLQSQARPWTHVRKTGLRY